MVSIAAPCGLLTMDWTESYQNCFVLFQLKWSDIPRHMAPKQKG